MNCPDCNHVGAYVGAVTIECPNFHCRHYSIRQYRDYVDAATSKSPAGSPLPPPAHDDGHGYQWRTHHYDFGDI